MSIVKIPKSELAKVAPINEALLAKINALGIPVEQVTETDVELEVLPNRSDALSASGFLRALRAFLGKDKGLKKYVVKKSGCKLVVEKSLPKEWPFAIACIVKGIIFTNERIKEIIDIQEKLGATLLRQRRKGGIGLYPLEKIKFPVRFTGKSPEEIKFRPLEHPDTINGREILSKHPKGREYAHICQEWEKFPVFVDSNNCIMSMPPIINAHDMGKIDETTRDVFLEATGRDIETLTKALVIVATALAEMGGTIYSIECIQQKGDTRHVPDLRPEKRTLSLEHTNQLLGLDLKERELEKLLPRMGYDYKKGIVSVPAWRADILHEVDIIEDIAIAYGYESLLPVLPNVATVGEESPESKLRSILTEALIGLGLVEISTYHLITQQEALRIPEAARIELENAKTEYKVLRSNLLLPALRIISENKDNEYPQRLFEIGRAFTKDKRQETGIAEPLKLSIVCMPGNFTEMKQILNVLSSALACSFSLKETENKYCIEGRTAAILLNGKDIGFLGELHPETLQERGLKLPGVVLEISLEQLLQN
jgi:phenylalanyl-tRNA synthetase beta chain